MHQTSLILEGGGMRGVFTSGVLDYLMTEDMFFPYVIGVSAGACNALSYLSRQPDRSRYINVNFANDPRYINMRNVLRGKGMFNMDFLFNDIANELVPFDFETFHNINERFVIPTTDCETGKPCYFDNAEETDIFTAVQASSSLPLVGVPIELDGHTLLDGGIADPIPVQKAIDDGFKRHLVILTRPKGYRKKPFRAKFTSKLLYREYPKLVETMLNRHEIYNKTLDQLEALEDEGKVFIIRPKGHEQVKRAEKDVSKLNALHEAGVSRAKEQMPALKAWLSANKQVKIY